MTIQRAFKTKLRLNNRQEAYFVACAGAARFVYNWALADRIERYKEGLSSTKFEQKKRFNAWKKDNAPWLAEYPYKLVDYAFDDLDAAYQNFFRRIKTGVEKVGFPKFRSRHKSVLRFSLSAASVHIEANRIKLPRIGWVTLEEANYIPTSGAKLNRVTISERAGCWYVSAQMEVPDPPQTAHQGTVGVDLGIKTLAVASDGTTFDNPKTLAKYERRLARLQCELNRRVKGSRNRSKTKTKIAKLHKRIADTRQHTLHNVSAHVVYGLAPERIVLEDLNVKGMTANHKLAKAVVDASMSELGRQIEYKAAWTGVEVVYADRWFPSSKTCSCCGHVQDMPLSVREYKCPQCGMAISRDLNAAINLAKYGR
jgi:putative transposase